MRIRKAQIEDIPRLQEIARRLILKNYTPFLGHDNVSHYINSGQSDNEITIGIEHCFVAEKKESIIGFVIIDKDLLHLLMIDILYQNKGYGTLLLDFIEKEMFNEHAIIKLQTFERNIESIEFYKKRNWIFESIEYIKGMDMNMIHMQKKRHS